MANLPANPTAALVVIGNEILSGKTLDTNTPFLCGELRALGVELRRIVTLADDLDAIGHTVRELAQQHTWVFTSGGIGPTHDDVTYAAIAQGFGCPLEISPVLEAALKARNPQGLKPAHLHMARVPQGAEVFLPPGVTFPQVRFRNVLILPGVPQLFRAKFSAMRHLFGGPAFCLREVFLQAEEVPLAEGLRALAQAHPQVQIGSYPVSDQAEYSLRLALEARNDTALEATTQALLAWLHGLGITPVKVA